MIEQVKDVSLNVATWSISFFTQLVVVGIALLLCGQSGQVSAAAASNPEAQCISYVQDKIKWNYDHNSRWETENVNKLCNGTSEFKQPGECFHKVMHGGTYGNDGISWGKGTKWNWRNAAALCAGTNNAENRISCFKEEVKRGEGWRAAIAQCVRLASE